MAKAKAIFFLSTESFIRNYISANTLDVLRKNMDCHFLIDEKFSEHPQLDKLEKKIYYTSVNYKSYDLIFDYSIWYHRKNSKSFRTRIKRTRGLDFHFFEQQNWARKTVRIGFRLLRFLKYRLQYFLFANPITYPLTFGLLNSLANKNKSLEKEIIQIGPDLVIYPSNAYEAIGIDIVKICKRQAIKSIFIIDNWDNVSSKSILWEKPDRLLVWGEQTKKHAVKFQHFASEKVTQIGTSRFDQYFKLRETEIPSHFNFNYILFVGYSLHFDEAKLVQKIDQIITNNKDIFGDIKLIYRPHPHRQSKDSIEGMSLQNTFVDPQLKEWYFDKEASKSNTIQPALDYYPSLLSNAEMVIASLTSMIIESLIFKKRTLVIGYKEKNNPSNPYQLLHNYHHFDELFFTEGIDICVDFDEFEENLISSWKNKDKINYNQLDKDCRHLCHNNNEDYATRLYNTCKAEIE